MENVKVTKKNKFEMLSNALALLDQEGMAHDFDVAMLQEFIANEVAHLDNKAAKAKENAAAKKTEIDDLGNAVLNALTDEPMTRDQVFDLVADFSDDVSVAKVGARLSKLVDLGRAVKSEVKATSASGKKTTRMAYAIAPVDADADAE